MRKTSEKKKVDYGALNSPFMRIPRMNVRGARALLDLKFSEIYELRGRDPNALFADYKKINKTATDDILKYISTAVEFAENE
jgi:hypothetical protein